LYLVTFLVALYISVIYFIIDPTTLPFMEAKLNISEISFQLWKKMLYAHMIIGFLGMCLGMAAFKTSRSQNPKLHKTLGIIYTFVVFINAFIVPYLAYYATGGFQSTIAFFILDAVWLTATWVSVWRMAQGKFTLHREWMMRSYALTLFFVTFKLVQSILNFAISDHLNLVYPLSIYLALVINLAAVEFYLFWTKKKAKQQPVATVK
jgi:hypothetical protein